MRWNLRMKAAERGIWKSTELRRMLAAAGLEVSAGKMSGWWTGRSRASSRRRGKRRMVSEWRRSLPAALPLP